MTKNTFAKSLFVFLFAFLIGAGLITQVALGSTFSLEQSLSLTKEITPEDGQGHLGDGG